MAITTEAHWVLSANHKTSYAVATITGDTPAEASSAAHKAAQLAGKNAPKRTGRLSRSYGVTGAGKTRTVRSSVPWSGHQEFGAPRAHVPAKPHLRPALKQVERQFNAKSAARRKR